ncbi:MAG: glycosyltransferase [Fervidobacterium sp.]
MREDYRKMLNITEDEVVFVSVARLTPEKDHLTLIKVFENVSKLYRNTKLFLVGDGPMREELQREVREREIGDRVIFLGIRKDVPEILSASDVFVLSSIYEGNPLSVMEAMAAGKPVIATSVGGVPELVDDGETGILVKKGNVTELEKAMISFLENRKLIKDVGSRGRDKAIKYFDVSYMTEEYGKLYRELFLKKRNM